MNTRHHAKLTLTAAAGVLAAVLGVGLPLELLPQLSGMLHYLAHWQILIVLAELSVVFAAAGLLLALPVVLTCAAAQRLKPGGGHLVAAIMVRFLALVFLFHAMRTWLLAIGPFAKGAMVSQPWLWAGLSLAGLALIGAHVARRPVVICPAVVSRSARVTGGLLAVGMVLRVAFPLYESEAQGASSPRPMLEAGRHPDVVLITIDTLSALHMSLYGYARDTTPNLSALAASSTVFDRFYANGNFTTAGMSSMMLGTRPWTHGAVLAPSTPHRFAEGGSLLGTFHEAGYEVIAVSTNPWASPVKLGLMRHVDRHVESHPWRAACTWDADAQVSRIVSPQTASLLGVAGYWAPWRLRLLRWAIDTGRCPASGHFNPEDALQAALLEWGQAARHTRPVLLWVHLTPPHDPYAPPEPFVGTFDPRPQARRIDDSSPLYHYLPPETARIQHDRLHGRYDEAIRYVDHSVGEFLGSLRKSGRLDGSLLVVSADHGESFGHDYGAHGGPELFEDVVRIPLLIRLPRQTVPGRVMMPAEQADLWPTLTELAGLSAPPANGLEGRSLAVAAKGGSLAERPVYSMTFERQPHRKALAPGTVTVMQGRWKLHRKISASGATSGPSTLFDVVSDPAELQDRAMQEPAIAAALEALVDVELNRRRGPS